MALEVNGAVMATARFSQCAAADGNGAWIASTHPARLFNRSQAITALTLAECLAVGFGDNDPFVMSWRKEQAALPTSVPRVDITGLARPG
jgi:hypothetical protein